MNVRFDGAKPWFALVREDETRISLKKNQFAIRLRLRDQSGALLEEMTPSLNGLVASLDSPAWLNTSPSANGALCMQHGSFLRLFQA